MSQYPSPYTPPPAPPNYPQDFSYYQPQQDPLAPAKRASVMLFVVGGLVLLPSCCCGAMALALPAMMAQQPAAFGDLTAQGMSPHAIQITLGIAAGVALFLGAMMIVLGRFVRRGSMGAAITATVLAGLILLYLLLNGLGIVVMAGKLPQPQVLLGLAMTVLGLVVFGLLVLWLIQAAIASSRVAAMNSEYQQRYWQYQQQQQMYQAGYVAPPPPHQQEAVPPPPPPPPPDSPSGEGPNAPSA